MDEVCVLCVVRKTVGLPDLHWIWILPEHRFSQPTIHWLSTAVSALRVDSQSQNLSPVLVGIQNVLSIFISASSISMHQCVVLLPPCFFFQLPRETVRRLLQRQCRTAGGSRSPNQRVLRWIWHLVLQDSFPKWLNWPVACFGNHAGPLIGPASCFNKRWEGTASNCHLNAKFVAVLDQKCVLSFRSKVSSPLDKPGNVCRRTIADLFDLCFYWADNCAWSMRKWILVRFSFTAMFIHIVVVSVPQGPPTVPTCTLPGEKIHSSSL